MKVFSSVMPAYTICVSILLSIVVFIVDLGQFEA